MKALITARNAISKPVIKDSLSHNEYIALEKCAKQH